MYYFYLVFLPFEDYSTYYSSNCSLSKVFATINIKAFRNFKWVLIFYSSGFWEEFNILMLSLNYEMISLSSNFAYLIRTGGKLISSSLREPDVFAFS